MRKFWLAASICLIALTTSATAQKVATLVRFDETNGQWPMGLIQGVDGDLYGPTSYGGAYNDGEIFRATPSGLHKSFYSFNCLDLLAPISALSLMLASDGNFYGTAGVGYCGYQSPASVFKLTAKGVETTLYEFPCSENSCQNVSYGPLLQGSDGNLYGATANGGSNSLGSIFKITPKGVLTTIYSFCSQANCADGEITNASLVQGSDGYLYGTTAQGGTGANQCASSGGCGTVFKLTTAGDLTTLYSFCSRYECTDGALPNAGLVLAPDGNFFGTTSSGGNSPYCDYDCGTVFRITAAGKFSKLYNFCSHQGCADGWDPPSGLLVGSDGNLYGTTTYGGNPSGIICGIGCGTIFEIELTGKLRTLYRFCSLPKCSDGAFPGAGLFQSTNGTFYGTTSNGGTDMIVCSGVGCGTVFSLDMGLGPFVQPVMTMGKIGAKVIILGNNLTGSTAVSFNGTAASFTVVSDTLITTAVPSGAVTGTLSVTTPSGTLNSNGSFYVLP
jgi:uncharacterized repeat protein (TIGR03803 family)